MGLLSRRLEDFLLGRETAERMREEDARLCPVETPWWAPMMPYVAWTGFGGITSLPMMIRCRREPGHAGPHDTVLPDGARLSWGGEENGPECGRLFAPPLWADYKFCRLRRGHAGECVFQERRRPVDER